MTASLETSWSTPSPKPPLTRDSSVSAHRQRQAARRAAVYDDTVRRLSRRMQRPRDPIRDPRRRSETLGAEPSDHVREGRTVPPNDEEMADRSASPARHTRSVVALIDAFVDEYNHRRPHRSLGRTIPAVAYKRQHLTLNQNVGYQPRFKSNETPGPGVRGFPMS